MGLPDSEKAIQDLLDYMTEGSWENEIILGVDGKPQTVSKMNHKKIYYETRLINHPNFGRYVYVLESFDALADNASNFMPSESAKIFAHDVRKITSAHRFSIDAKSSETLRDKYNTQPALVDKLNKTVIQKSVTLDQEVKKGFFSSFGHSVAEQEARD